MVAGCRQRVSRGVTLLPVGVAVAAEAQAAAGDLAGYGAFVIGSAVYAMHWQKDAAQFVRRNRALLAGRPVWLFSSGPLGTEATDAKGRDLTAVTEPIPRRRQGDDGADD